MEGSGGGRFVARSALGLAACAIAVAGVFVATEGVTFPVTAPAGPTVTLAPAAAALGCASAGPYHAPERGSVGVPAGLRLCPGEPVTVSVPGTVLDGWDVQGGIVVDAADVVVRRSRVTGDGTMPYGIATTPAGSVRIEDVTLTGDFTEAAIGGDRWSAERVEITRVTSDGAHLGDGARLRNSTVHDFATPPGGAPGGETDALVLQGTGRDVVVEDNRVELGRRAGSAVLVAPGRAGERAEGAVEIRGNLLGGGTYTLRQDGPAAAATDVRITGNRFRRDAERAPMRVPRRAVLEDNTYLDGGQLPDR
ncbi:hypothetical protein BJF78_17230 [Pseudonocardia sp. CNS-139]|nr:hypothetical protein BJF78_17230 [Pseudonocardia sp. CNS-139]